MKLQRGNIAQRRQYVLKAQDWNRAAGTDFWYFGGPASHGAAGDDLITDFGWTATSITSTQGTLADLLSSADVGTPNISALDAASDLLVSPTIFGDYAHGLQASKILGYYPTRLCLEVYANFSVATANETTSGVGLSTGTPLTAGNHIAYIISNGTNFLLRNAAGTTDAGAAVDNVFHLWKIVATTASTIEWFIDGTSQGTLALTADLFPTAFAAGIVAAGTNRVNIAQAHVWYE